MSHKFSAGHGVPIPPVCCLPQTLKQPSLRGFGKEAPKLSISLPFSIKLELFLPWLVFPVEDKFMVAVGRDACHSYEISLLIGNWHKQITVQFVMPALHRVIFTSALGHPSSSSLQSRRVLKLWKQSGIFSSMCTQSSRGQLCALAGCWIWAAGHNVGCSCWQELLNCFRKLLNYLRGEAG